jgi:hypothetical protein
MKNGLDADAFSRAALSALLTMSSGLSRLIKHVMSRRHGVTHASAAHVGNSLANDRALFTVPQWN